MSAHPMALQASNLQVSLSGQKVLHGIDVSFAAGRWTSIVGPNGAGKSTLLKALAGLLPASGRVHLFDKELMTVDRKLRAQQLSWLGKKRNSVR